MTELERLNKLVEQLRMEAQIQAGEARTANATLAEIYQAVTGATGEPGNWNGAAPVIKRLNELKADAVSAQDQRLKLWSTLDRVDQDLATHGEVSADTLCRVDYALKSCAPPADPEAVWNWFGLSYASFLILPRVLLSAMPGVWQSRFVALLEEFHDTFDTTDLPTPYAQARGSNGKITRWPSWLVNYRRPDTSAIDQLRKPE